MALLKQNLQYCALEKKFKASYVYNELLPTLPVYEAACKRVAISLERKLTKDGLYQATEISTITLYMGGIKHYVHGYWPQRSGQRQSVNQCNSLTNIHLKVEVGRDSNPGPLLSWQVL